MVSSQRAGVRVKSVQAVTPHNQALYEAGKKLLVDSVETGREFCKFMITTNMAAIPVYLGLLKLMLPEGFRPTLGTGTVLLTPALLFMTGASLSVVGFMPRLSSFSLDLPREIDAERMATIQRRRRYALAAVLLFALSVLASAALAIWALGLPHTS